MWTALKTLTLLAELVLTLHGDVHPRHERHEEPRKPAAAIVSR